MNKTEFTTSAAALFIAFGLSVGCDRSPSKAPAVSSTAPATQDREAGHEHSQDQAQTTPPHTAREDSHSAPPPAQETERVAGSRLALAGLTMLPDPDWVAVPFEAGSLAPVAVFALPAESAEVNPVQIRITHYPGMKGPQMDQMNIKRWVGSVRRADGTPATTEDAKITGKTLGHVRLTIVDITGTVMPTMGEQTTGLGDQRLIAAIVDHPEGPHFVKAMGPTATIAKWEQRILDFLDSAAVTK